MALSARLIGSRSVVGFSFLYLRMKELYREEELTSNNVSYFDMVTKELLLDENYPRNFCSEN